MKTKKRVTWNLDLLKEWVDENRFDYKFKSTEYKNNKTKMLWECPEGHNFEMCWSNFKNGQGCLKCSGKEKLKFIDVKNYIESFEGWICHSTKYNDNKTKLDLECPCGHRIKMRFLDFMRGHRCRNCFYKQNSGSNHYHYNHYKDEASLKIIHYKSEPYKNKFRKLHNNFDTKNFNVDHIIPIVIFAYLKIYDLDIINDFTNLQILTDKENKSKGSKCLAEDVYTYINSKQEFINKIKLIVERI